MIFEDFAKITEFAENVAPAGAGVKVGAQHVAPVGVRAGLLCLAALLLSACHPTTAKWDPAVDLAPDSILQPTSKVRASHAGYLAGRRLMQEARYAEAEGRLTEALTLDPGNHAARFILGSCRFMQWKEDHNAETLAAAVEALNQAVAARPEDAEYMNLLATALLNAGRLDEAVGHFADLAARFPRWPDPRYHLAEAAAVAGDPGGAMVHLKKAADLHGLIRERAAKNPLFRPLADREDFRQLVGAAEAVETPGETRP